MLKKVIRLFLVLVMGVGVFNFSSLVINATGEDYEIYPNPHSVTYQTGEYVMRGQVNVVYDDTIDNATKSRLDEVLQSKGKEISVSNEKDSTKTNIFVGTYGTNGNASNYLTSNYAVDSEIASKNGGHQVFSNNGEIGIIGKDSDATFYGVTSLMHIFNQIEGSTLRNFLISDYADTNIRGFIEGYYGIPWSNDDRKSLMQFGGDFKMTAYIFAPKDDPYHSGKWRLPYPEDKLLEIQEMAAVGEASKCRFVWTIHPFMNGGITAASYDQDIQKIIDKFEQLYGVGVRQFGVLGDDAGSLPRSVVTRVMNDLQAWSKEKGDVYDLVFCPGGYNTAWWANGELDEYDRDFDESIQIFWTGDSVCAPVSQNSLTNFKTFRLPAGNNPRRSPLFWLNWPVNDINGARLMMGKGSLLHTDINISDLAGVVTNPMQEAEASKVALFAVADYAWNVKGFNDNTSWANSFKYIDRDAGEYLHTLSKHMSNPQPNGHGLVLAESEELKPLINEFKNALSTKNAEAIKLKGGQLIEEMNIIIEACDGFNRDSKNANLVKELIPFTGSLKDLSMSIKNSIESKIALIDGDSMSAFNYFTNATANLTNSKKHDRKLINGQKAVSPGSTELIPLAEMIQKEISSEVGDVVNGGDDKLVITGGSSFTSFQAGSNESIVDGNLSTSAWHNGYEAVGQYFQVNLSKPTTIYGIDIANGTADKPADTFKKAKLVYSTDNGANWLEVNGLIYGDYEATVSVTGLKLDNVTNLRYICTENGRNWPAMREFGISTEPALAPEFSREIIRTTDKWGVYSGAESNILDGDNNTGVHYRVRQGDAEYGDSSIAGDYIGVKLSKPIILGKIHIVQAPSESSADYFSNCDLEYSVNGVDWVKIESFTSKVINTDLSNLNITAQYVRIKNTQTIKKWIGMREFQVEAKVFFNSFAYTNVDAYKNVKANVVADNGVLEASDGMTLKKDQYIGIQLKRIHKLKEISVNLTTDDLLIEVSKNGYEWESVTAGLVSNDARYVRLINKTDNSITFDINKFSIHTDEIAPKKVTATSGFSVSKSEEQNLFDGEWATQTVFNGSQNKGRYVVYDLGQEINLDAFKAVCRDSERDFARHGKFSVSIDGNDWTEIMTIGNQDGENEGEAATEDNINDVFPTHEISYNTKEVTGLKEKARYIKFEITRTKVGEDRWVRFQEFVINGGAYLSEENNPTITSTSPETKSSQYGNMLDSNLITMFAPEDKNGSLNYSVSEKNEVVNTLKIIQDSNKISNAVVSARVKSSVLDDIKWVELGTLNQTINEFVLVKDSAILDIKVEWENTEIAISEIKLLTKTDLSADKDRLNDLVNDLKDTTTWTLDSVMAYTQAMETAKLVLKSSNTSQSSIDSAIILIENSIKNKVEKGDVSSLDAAISNAITDSTQYTSSTWKAYSKAIENGKTGVINKDNLSQDEIDKLVNAINTATTNLVFNPINRELAMLTKQDIDLFVASITTPNELYTINSFNALVEAQLELSELVKLDETEAQLPSEFLNAKTKAELAKETLVSVQALPALINAFDSANEALYTTESFAAYRSAVEAARGLLINGTQQTIDSAVSQVESARAELIIDISLKNLKEYITELEKKSKEEYTQKTINELSEEIKSIKAKTDSDLKKNFEKYTVQLQKAENNLISIVSLKAKVKQAKGFDANKFVKSSFELLLNEIENAEKLYIDGSKEQIFESTDSLDKGINSLEIRVNEDDAKAYIQSLSKLGAEVYTEASYDKYLNAFNTLKAMIKNLENISLKEYNQAKVAYDNAYKGLVVNSGTPTVPEKPLLQGTSVVPNTPTSNPAYNQVSTKVELEGADKVKTDNKNNVTKKVENKTNVEDTITPTTAGSTDNNFMPFMIGGVLLVLGALSFIFVQLKKRKIQK